MLLRLPDSGDVAPVVRSQFDVPIVSLAPVIGGWDEDAAVWDGLDENGRRWAVKTSRRDITFGLAVASSLAEEGTLGIVAPLRACDGRPWAESGGAIVTVAPWVDGLDASDLGTEDVDWERFGGTLRAIHDHPAPPRPRPVRRGIRRSRRSMAALIDGLDRRFDVDTISAPGVDALRATWRSARGRVDALAAAERLLKRRRTAVSRVTLHGDPHLGNVVLDSAGGPWLIDFDESTVAPREVDLMLIELGVLFSLPISDEQRCRFRAGYGSDAPVDEERLARFGAVRAIEDLVWTLHRALDDDPRAPAGYDETLDGMLGPAGQMAAVERALERLDTIPPRTTSKEQR